MTPWLSTHTLPELGGRGDHVLQRRSDELTPNFEVVGTLDSPNGAQVEDLFGTTSAERLASSLLLQRVRRDEVVLQPLQQSEPIRQNARRDLHTAPLEGGIPAAVVHTGQRAPTESQTQR